MSAQLKPKITDNNVGGLVARQEEGNRFTDTNNIPWTEFYIDGVDFKLLNYDGERVTIVTRIKKGTKLAIHQHMGPVELYVIEGSFGYKDAETGRDNMIYAGGYLYEPPSTVHEPVCPDGLLAVAVVHGPLKGFAADGSEVYIGPKEYYEMAKANNAIAHLTETRKVAGI
ncbi:MAG: cupin domain-containing protein [Flavobacteriaceae bacterium]